MCYRWGIGKVVLQLYAVSPVIVVPPATTRPKPKRIQQLLTDFETRCRVQEALYPRSAEEGREKRGRCASDVI